KLVAFALIRHLHFERIATGFRLGQAEGKNLVPLARRRKITPLLLLVAPRENRILANGCMSGEEGAAAGAFAIDACERAGVGHGVGGAAAVLGRHDHAEQVVFLCQRNQVMVEAMLDVAELFVLAQFLAKGVDIAEQTALFGGMHRGLPPCPVVVRCPCVPGPSEVTYICTREPTKSGTSTRVTGK